MRQLRRFPGVGDDSLNIVQQSFRDLNRFAVCLQFAQFQQVDCVSERC
jgi:hypothetical protein